MIICKFTVCLHLLIKSFDREGWAVGVAVTATDTIVQASRRDTTKGWWTMSLIVQFAKISTLSAMALSSGLPRRRLLTLKGDTQHCLYICIAVVGRGVTTQRHLTEGAAGKTTLH